MLKNILNLGKTLERKEQKNINGGQTIYFFGYDCYKYLCSDEPVYLPGGDTALCAHPYTCDDPIYQA